MDYNENPGETEDFVVIAEGSPATLQTLSLVLSAMGIDHVLDSHRNALLVHPKKAEQALYQIHRYLEENPDNRSAPEPVGIQPPGDLRVTVFLVGLLAYFFYTSGDWFAGNPWFEAGAVDRNNILVNRQWWRIVTALTLHADTVHLIGNCLIGGHMIAFLSRQTGYGLCWLLVLITGATGNLINILVRDQQHLSVGFSTSVFGVIGVLAGLRMLHHRNTGLKEFLLPLGAGFGLLAFLGSEGARTDIGAHAFGFVVGIVAGMLTHALDIIRRTADTTTQRLLLLVAVGTVFLCWLPALERIKTPLY